jgi:iron complex outermembrane recepter protein
MTMIRSNAIGARRAVRLAGVVGAIGAVATTAPAVRAQDTGSVLDEIIVTATRRSESVQDVPYNIQAISSQTLELMGAVDQKDFARMVPGLAITDKGARSGVDFVLRGLTTGPVGSALGQTTTAYVDDTQTDLYFRSLDLKLVDVERIEVLRGPQGTLYGGGAIGGTVRYISKKPDLSGTSARASSGLSSTQGGGTNYDVNGMLNMPVVEDKLAFRANVGYFDNAGYIDNVRTGRDNINWDRTLTGRFALLAQPTDELRVELTHYYQRGHYGAWSDAYETLGGHSVDTYEPPVNEGQHTANLTNLSVTYDFGWSELTSSSSYINERLHAFDDNTYFIRDSVFASFLPPQVLPEINVSTERNVRARTFSQELRLVSQGTERWDWLAGLYWYDRKSSEKLQERVPTGFPGQAQFEEEVIGGLLNDDKEYYFAADPSTVNQWAVFGEVGFKVTPDLRMSIGGRHFDYRLRETFHAIDQFFGLDARDSQGLARTTPLSNEINLGRADDSGQIFRFNASYNITPDDLIYTTIAQGYRPGGFNLVTPNTGVPIDKRAYDPDSIVSYEVGGKLSLLDRQVYLSSAIYYIDWSDIQTLVPTDLGFSLTGNAGKASVRGFELELQSRGLFADGLSMALGYSYTDGKLDEDIVNLGLSGERVPRVPRHSGSFMVDYSFVGNGRWNAGINATTSYTGASFSQFGPQTPLDGGGFRPNVDYLPQDSYWLTNASARFAIDSWQLRLFVNNVFNEDIALSRTMANYNSPYRSPYVMRTVNQPRTVGLQLTWDFK